jgi:hypothetical protein
VLQLVLQPGISRQARQQAYPLDEAAQGALEIARRERLALARIAERDGPARALHWFASNMLRIIPVYGRRPGRTEHERIALRSTDELELREDLTSLRVAGEQSPAFVDLIATRSDCKRYIRWIRSVK